MLERNREKESEQTHGAERKTQQKNELYRRKNHSPNTTYRLFRSLLSYLKGGRVCYLAGIFLFSR